MSAEERQNDEPKTDEHHQVLEEREERSPTPTPEITEEHKEQAKEMAKAYKEDRPTVNLPGTDGAVSGTAVNEWIDDEGNAKYDDKSDTES